MSLIRRAEERDIPDVLRLLVQVDMVHHNGRPDIFRGPATKYGDGELRAVFADQTTPVFVACDEKDALLGYAFCVIKETKGDRLLCDMKTLYIDDLCVDESRRGQGVGRELYEYCLDFARRIGCHNLTLNVWACNPSAVRFYEKLGMVPQKIGMEKLISN